MRLKLTTVSESFPSDPLRLIRIEFEARSVSPPALAIADSREIRSSLSNSRAPGVLTSQRQKILTGVRGGTFTTSDGKIGMFHMEEASRKRSSTRISSRSERPFEDRRRT